MTSYAIDVTGDGAQALTTDDSLAFDAFSCYDDERHI